MPLNKRWCVCGGAEITYFFSEPVLSSELFNSNVECLKIVLSEQRSLLLMIMSCNYCDSFRIKFPTRLEDCCARCMFCGVRKLCDCLSEAKKVWGCLDVIKQKTQIKEQRSYGEDLHISH